MHGQVAIQHLNGRCAVLLVFVCILSSSEEELYGSISLKLAGQGYSPTTKTLLVAKIETDNHGKGSWLATYDEVSGFVKRVAIPEDRALVDFAWIPGRAAFVVADLEEVIFFQKDNSGDGYTPTPIQCLSGILPLECSWNPKGEWLAVTCLDEANAMRGALGLYKYGDKSLAKTGLALDRRPVTWGNDGLLYGTKDNEVLVIKVTDGKPRVVRTIPLREQLTLFYGIFGEQPLFQAEREVKLGDKRLMMLDQPYKFRVMATGKTIFVSASSTCLGVFDAAGHEIAEGNPGRLIKLGSVKDPNTVYGLADSCLVCLSVEKGALKIQTVADLSRLTGMGPGTVRKNGPCRCWNERWPIASTPFSTGTQQSRWFAQLKIVGECRGVHDGVPVSPLRPAGSGRGIGGAPTDAMPHLWPSCAGRWTEAGRPLARRSTCS